mmetsp:Transcript_14077/g.21047  ORF Transcript_14077/g.21047 Transcript_14077/m.21047 type:complete len:93 (+) Transcript_14077:108-386(+)
MFRRTLVQLSKTAERTIVRDPRKNKLKPNPAAIVQQQQEQEHLKARPPVPWPLAPGDHNEQSQSVGSSLGSYALAGAGMAMGFALVRVVFGV